MFVEICYSIWGEINTSTYPKNKSGSKCPLYLGTEFKDGTLDCDRVISLPGPAAVSLAENPRQFYRWPQTCGTKKKEKATRVEQKVIWDAWDQFHAPRRHDLISVSGSPLPSKITPSYFTGAVLLNTREGL